MILKQLEDRLAAVVIGVSLPVIGVLQVHRQAEDVEHSGHQVRGPIGRGRRSAQRRLADDLAHLQSAARKGQSGERGPVVAAGGRVQLRRAAELAGNDEEDVLVEPAIGQVLDERGDRLIDDRPFLFEPLLDRPVHVPAAVVNGDEADAGLAESAGQEHAFAEAGAVAVAKFRIFTRHVERGAGVAEDKVECLPFECVRPDMRPDWWRRDGAVSNALRRLRRSSKLSRSSRRVMLSRALPARSKGAKGRPSHAGPSARISRNRT